MRSFDNKVAVVTGAGSGIGRALALDLAHRGARLALSDIDGEALTETVVLCEKIGARTVSYQLDVSDRAAMYFHADAVISEFGRVNLVVNNAGVALGADVLDMTWDDFEWVMNIDFWGVVNGSKAFLPALIESGEGHLVNVSSVFGLMGIPGQSAYNSAKFAVRGFTEALRQEMKVARHPVGVSCVHPGGIKTNIVANARGMADLGDHDAVVRRFEQIAVTSPTRAAKVILGGVERNKPRILIGPDARLFDLIPRVVGPRYQDILAPLNRIGRATGARFGSNKG
ncbi:acetoin dehydrogenase [Rhodococcus sp. 1163]|uniref:SDR family NAD(P)-dependent oxidoreductase n=1 Tax=unclassified Rhodococcus (in: high G+C Gram-positive bacteria) TaxID=192944 RepID=UPI0009FCBB4B|nr:MULTISPECIES: SDR family NAD(P)-dependent oxidoreductase [unclassified Rhodococcus (in: high G+C Gram-positive bacteria)]ORI17943.1 acetoin dehydrogenase [Rhodococcus sp. 1163]QCB48962.1 SDR family NAD(P)-dependent oxidoreductase [Rhodococcus sp. PAMC28705]QCB59351.1 SDR family NAD(P)-dependent oxidoreductase [Rhodococcus sp. PAMC28707]